MTIFRIIGILGLLLITTGVLTQKKKSEDWYYISGGVLLEIYSIHIGDVIFMVLQVIFILAAGYHLTKNKLKNKNDKKK